MDGQIRGALGESGGAALAPPMCYNRLGFSPIGNAIL